MLINCKECKREISTKAKKCPHCGTPVKREFGCISSLVIGTVLLVIAWLMLGYFLGPESSTKVRAADWQIQRTFGGYVNIIYKGAPTFIYDVEVCFNESEKVPRLELNGYLRTWQGCRINIKQGDVITAGKVWLTLEKYKDIYGSEQVIFDREIRVGNEWSYEKRTKRKIVSMTFVYIDAGGEKKQLNYSFR